MKNDYEIKVQELNYRPTNICTGNDVFTLQEFKPLY